MALPRPTSTADLIPTINIAFDLLERTARGFDQIVTNPALTMPVGSIVAYGGASPPAGWLMCDGTAYNNGDYPSLSAAIGVNYGTAGAGTFRVPDLRDRTPVGVSGSKARGATGGAATVALATAEMPVHAHPIQTTDNGAGIAPRVRSTLIGAAGFSAASTDNAGSGTAHENMPPYQAVNFIIKTN